MKTLADLEANGWEPAVLPPSVLDRPDTRALFMNTRSKTLGTWAVSISTMSPGWGFVMTPRGACPSVSPFVKGVLPSLPEVLRVIEALAGVKP